MYITIYKEILYLDDYENQFLTLFYTIITTINNPDCFTISGLIYRKY